MATKSAPTMSSRDLNELDVTSVDGDYTLLQEESSHEFNQLQEASRSVLAKVIIVAFAGTAAGIIFLGYATNVLLKVFQIDYLIDVGETLTSFGSLFGSVTGFVLGYYFEKSRHGEE